MTNKSNKSEFKLPADSERTENTSRERKRKLIIPKKTNQVDQDAVVVVPTLNSLMNDALSIIGSELAQYRSKTARGVTLDLKEARVIANYMDTLTRASKESREQARAEDLADLSNEELLQLATQISGVPANASLSAPTGEVKSVSDDPNKPNPSESDE